MSLRATWDRLENYQVWLDRPVRSELMAQVGGLVAPAGEPGLYEVVHVWDSQMPPV